MYLNKTLIAGPCSAETEAQVLETARQLRGMGVDYFRAGLWKPRTTPGFFEGVGAKAIPWMQRVRREFGMPICTEVAFREHVELCLDAGFDLLWIGARTSANPFLMQELADALKGSDVTVLVKNPINPDVDLWLGAVERLRRAGLEKVGVIHRGFSSYEKIRYRNAPGWQIALELRRRCPDLPFFSDPSHMAGSAALVPEAAQHSLELDIDGLMVEVHCNPAEALSDAVQQLTPDGLLRMLKSLHIRSAESPDPAVRKAIACCRDEMDALDVRIVELLADRMDISRRLGELKKDNNLSIIQADRWAAVVRNVCAAARTRDLREDFVRSVFSVIHDASIDEQN